MNPRTGETGGDMPLSEQHLALLRAAVDRIIPADEYPGGWEAGVGGYLERLLGRDPSLRAYYQAGLGALDAEARAAFGRAFPELDAADQDAVLTRTEAGECRTPWTVPPPQFFARLVEHCMEGFYADPGNGGNVGMVSWRMIGFEVRG